METLGKKKPRGKRTVALPKNDICIDDRGFELTSVRSDGDRRWDELFASTTPEEFARLERALAQEDGEEDTPLDFSNR